MKKNRIVFLITFIPYLVQGQSALDALRYSMNFYYGTARSVAMGNAFTALGGDFGALTINPAASAVYPYSELIFSPSFHTTITQSDFLNSSFKDSYTRLGISNIGYVGSRSKPNYSGIVGYSFAFGYNGLDNYSGQSKFSGKTNQSSWLAALAYNTNGIHATDMDFNNNQNPFYSSSASWRSLLAWNTSLLDTIPGSGGRDYVGATEAFKAGVIEIPGTLRQDFYRKSVGNSGEYVFNFGLNFSHRLFLGVNLGLQSINYTTKERYSESVENSHDFYQTQFLDFTHTYSLKCTGTGVNLKIGAILVPVDNFRLGFSISTPTWLQLDEEWEETITANFSDYHQSLQSPLGEYSYQVKTPYRWNVGAAFTFGSLGAISFDYEKVAYNNIRLSSHGESINPFSNENNYVIQEFNNTQNLRAGLELNLSGEFSLRGGYAYYGNPEKNWGSNTHIASLGIGMNWGKSFFCDMTFMQQLSHKEFFTLYDDVYEGSQVVYPSPKGSQLLTSSKLFFSLGFRF